MDQVKAQGKMPMASPRKVWFRVILIALMLLISGDMGYSAFYDLFIEIPGVNVPRIGVTQNIPGMTSSYTRVEFFINTPTVGWLVALSSAGLCIAIGVRTLWLLFRNRAGIRSRVFVMAVLVLIQLVAYGVVIDDFLSSAGDFG